MHYATIYLEGDKYGSFAHADGPLSAAWLTFWVGLKSNWPNPLNARRVVVERPGWPFQTFLHE
jgi:hypothetical protein